MSTKREEEKNEKIIRGLMKLPPNRRCINCNSLGPQYVCTKFWTFVCTTCSGIHREFTHRVKSVSMSKFTSQEVEALQNGGNQRARELFLKAWDPQRQRLPDNSNVEKVREFIKNVYEQKKFTLEKPSDRPPIHPQSLRSHEDDTRRASSYHSYSQSPPYDFQYEERRYGKHAPALTRKPGSDRGLYEGKLSGFLSPSRFSDHTNDDRFANEGSNPRASDYYISSGGDPLRSDAFSPRTQRETEGPSGEISREIPKHHAALPNSDSDAISRNAGGRSLLPQRTVSLGSVGSYDSNSKSGNSIGSPEVAFESEKVEIFHDITSISPHPLQSSESGNFNYVDLFGATPQNVAPPTPTVRNSQKQESSSAQFTDFFQQFPASVPIVDEPKPSHVLLQPSARDLFAVPPEQQSAPSFNSKTFDAVTPNNEGWATFDRPQNILPMKSGNSAATALPASDVTLREILNPFSLVQNSSVQEFVSHEPSVVGPTFWSEGLQNAEGNPSKTYLWNAFEDPARLLPFQNVPISREHAAGHHALDIDKALDFGVYETLNNNGGNVETSDGIGSPSSSLSSHFNSMALHDSSMAPAVARVHRHATDPKPTNPFDLPYVSEIESGNTFWGMGCLQAALPNDPMPTSYVGGVSSSWLPQNSGASYVPGGATFHSPSGSLGFMAGQTPSTQTSNVPTQDPVASIGGNPFA